MNEDKIVLERLEFFGRHGVHDAERSLGQRFVVDLEIVTDLASAGRTDDLNQTIDYGQVYRAVKAIVEGEPQRLIESVAERIAQTILSQWQPNAVRVRVAKPAAPLPGVFGEVAVEIVRHKQA